MGMESTTKKLGRVRPPRVHITYDVQVGDAIEKRELPFVVGVLSDLSGQPEQPLPKFGQRKFFEIDRESFNDVMARQKPRLVFDVENTLLNDKSTIGLEMRFNSMADFRPENVARQVEPLRKLVELRDKLTNLRSELYGNDKLEKALQDAVKQTEELRKPAAASLDSVDTTPGSLE